MARLNTARFSSSRRDPYDVPSDSEKGSQHASSESDGNASASKQLLQESAMNAAPPLPVQEMVAETLQPISSPSQISTGKSVRFQDPVAEESANLLQQATQGKLGTKRGRKQGKFVRPSVILSPPAEFGRLKRRPKKAQNDVFELQESPELIDTRKRSETLESEPSTTRTNGDRDRDRRSARPRNDVATYNDTDNARHAAGLSTLSPKKAPAAISRVRNTTPETPRRSARSAQTITSSLLFNRSSPEQGTSVTAINGAANHKSTPSTQENGTDGDRTPRARTDAEGDRRTVRTRNDVTTYNDKHHAGKDPWTAEDDRRLEDARAAGQSWDEIQKAFPNRTSKALEVRAAVLKISRPSPARVQNRGQSAEPEGNKSTSLGGRFSHWTKKEDEKLEKLRAAGKSNKQIQKLLPGRSLKAIEARNFKLDSNNKRKSVEPEDSTPNKRRRVQVRHAARYSASPVSQKTHIVPQTKKEAASQLRKGTRSYTEAEAQIDTAKSKFRSGEADEDEGLEDQLVVVEDIGRDEEESSFEGQDPEKEMEDEGDIRRNSRNDSALDDMIIDQRIDPDKNLFPRLFGLFLPIRNVAEAASRFQSHTNDLGEVRPASEPFQTSDSLRRTFRQAYKGLVASSNEAETLQYKGVISASLPKLLHFVFRLDPDTARGDKRKHAQHIYTFIFADLVKTLCSAVYTHINTTESDEDITSKNLSELICLTQCIVELGDRSRGWETKVDSKVDIVKRVRNAMVAPLKKILKTFEQQKRRLVKKEQRAVETLRQTQTQREQRALEEQSRMEELERKAAEIQRRTQTLRQQREDEEFRRRETYELEDKMVRLRALYIARVMPERNLHRRISVLAMPDFRRRQVYPLDANGEPFEREEVFQSRSSIPHMDRPGAEVEEEDWTAKELDAMQDGLKTIPRNRLFWEKFFNKYCKGFEYSGGPLRDRNVAEILKGVAEFRESVIEDSAEDEVPDWIMNVPDLDLMSLL